jgi:hypothetical protein
VAIDHDFDLEQKVAEVKQANVESVEQGVEADYHIVVH